MWQKDSLRLQQKASGIFEQYIKHPKPMTPLTSPEERKFQLAESCHICDEHLGKDRVRDHCHILSHFQGAAHNQCNLNFRIKPDSWKLPVTFHNLRGYDGHLIVKVLKKQHGKTHIIATIWKPTCHSQLVSCQLSAVSCQLSAVSHLS